MTTALATISDAEIAVLRRAVPRAFGRPLAERLAIVAGWIAFAGLIAFCLWRVDFAPQRLWQGLWKLGWLLQLMWPPWHGGWLWEFSHAMLQTLAMAFLGTLLAGLAAVPLGFLGARNVVPQALFHFGLRRLFDGIRGVDALIWALMFVNVVGLGPFAGVVAIAVSDTGPLAKLFAKAVENIDPRPVDGVRASGANRLQIVRFGILPQVLPVMLSYALYFLESNTRSATILGVVGAGGIGLQLADRIRVNNWDEVAFILIMILVAVTSIDLISKAVRHRIIQAGEASPIRMVASWQQNGSHRRP
jgi:phosphonate transport system permease protein